MLTQPLRLLLSLGLLLARLPPILHYFQLYVCMHLFGEAKARRIIRQFSPLHK